MWDLLDYIRVVYRGYTAFTRRLLTLSNESRELGGHRCVALGA